MSSILGMPRPESKFVDAEGRISRDWYFFLSYMLQQVGGPVVAPGVGVNSNGTSTAIPGGGISPLEVQKQYEEYPLTNPDAEEALRGVDELRNAYEVRQDPLVHELSLSVDELRNEIAYSKNDAQALRSVIDDLMIVMAAPQIADSLRNRIELIEDRLA